MLVGATTFVLNSLLVKNLISNLKKRSHLKSYDEVEVPERLMGLTLAIPIKNEAENLKRFLPLLERQHSQPESIIFLVDESVDESAEYLRRFQTSFLKTNVRVIQERGTNKVGALKKLLENVSTE